MQAVSSQRIVVFIPKGSNTGGPECLHQFVGVSRSLNYPVFIAYYTGLLEIVQESYFNTNYQKYFDETSYQQCQVRQIQQSDHLIFPEVEIAHLGGYQSNSITIWWLSIDNAIGPVRLALHSNYYYRFYAGVLAVLFRYNLIDNPKRLRLLYPVISTTLGLQRFGHLCQSFYAFQSFEGILPRRKLLGDFTDFWAETQQVSPEEKQNIVLFNPKKGLRIMEWFIHNYPEISWVPIENMSKTEVYMLLQRSKIYIDFGNHPGKDRIPREATLCGCVVITNREGSALFYEDVGISDVYKFVDPLSQSKQIISLIQDVFANYENHRIQQNGYLYTVRNELQTFKNQVVRVVDSILNKGENL